MEPPTATIAICPAVSWWRRPSSGADFAEATSVGIPHHIKNGGPSPGTDTAGKSAEFQRVFHTYPADGLMGTQGLKP